MKCKYATIGDENFCKTEYPCWSDEGDCDTDDECLDGLDCGSNNCPASLSFDSETDCCKSQSQLKSPNYPNNYFNNAFETWLLTQESATFVILEFVAFKVSIFYI